MKRNGNTLLLFILLAAVLFRLIFVNTVPAGVNHDQLYYLLNAKSFFLTGKDISNTVSLKDVFLFHYPPGDLVQSELPFVLSILSSGPFPFSIAAYALPNIILSIFTVLLIYVIAKKLFDRKVALICAAVAAVNPWLIFSARIMYEMTPVMFFYLLGFYILLRAKKWQILWAFPVFILAFYSYIAQKIIMIPLLLLFIVYSYFFVHKKKFLRQYIVLIGFSLIFILFYFFQLSHQSGFSRLSEITTPNSPQIAFQINEARRLSVPSHVTNIVENKFSQYLYVNVKLLFETLSPTFLFLNGDYFFSLGNQGLFYLIDVVFIVIGSIVLFSRKRVLFFFISAGILIGTIPQLIHDPTGNGGNFSPHITMIVPFIIFFIGYGISQGFLLVKKKKHKKVFKFIVVFVYALLVLQFSVRYYFELPFKTGLFDFTSREVARYVSLSKKSNKPVVVYVWNTRDLFRNYLFYTNEYNKQTAGALNKQFAKQNYSWKNVTFDVCSHMPKTNDKKKIYIINSECKYTLGPKYLTLALLKDSGEVYKIYNDSVCGKYHLGRYIDKLQMKDFSVEQLSEKRFCQKYITKL